MLSRVGHIELLVLLPLCFPSDDSFFPQKVLPGNIIVRQRGTRFHPGNYVGMGKDHTLFCLKEGHVRFERNKLSGRKWVHVDPVAGHDLHPIYADGFATTADTEPLQ
jgi:large subunit ribosomal protein L27